MDPHKKRKRVRHRTNAASSSKTEPSIETERVAEERISFGARTRRTGESFISQDKHVITYETVSSATVSEAHRQEPHTAAISPRLDQPKDNHLEEISIPQTAREKPNSNIRTTINNA